MSTIVCIGYDRYLNIDQVKHIKVKNGFCVIVLVDGEVLEVDECWLDHLLGRDNVVQIVPAVEIEAVYEDFDKSRNWVNDVDYIAVCADGSVRGMEFIDSSLDFSDSASNFKKYRYKTKEEGYFEEV